MKIKLSGKLYEIGNLSYIKTRGFRLEKDGETIEMIGLTEEECRELAPFLGEVISIEITTS